MTVPPLCPPEPLENDSEPGKAGTKPRKAAPDLEDLDLGTAGTATPRALLATVSPAGSPGAVPPCVTLCHPTVTFPLTQGTISAFCHLPLTLSGDRRDIVTPCHPWW